MERAMRRGRHGADAVEAVGDGAAASLQVAAGGLAAAATPDRLGVVAHVCFSSVTGGLSL